MDILNQFGVQPILLAAQVVNFLILLFILKKFMYKPLLKVLDERKQKIADSLKNAEEIEKRLLEIGEREAQALLKSAKEGEKIIKEARDAGSQILEETRKEAEQIIIRATEQAKQLMVQEKDNLQQSVRENVADLIFTVIQKVTGKILTQQDKKKIADESIKSLRS